MRCLKPSVGLTFRQRTEIIFQGQQWQHCNKHLESEITGTISGMLVILGSRRCYHVGAADGWELEQTEVGRAFGRKVPKRGEYLCYIIEPSLASATTAGKCGTSRTVRRRLDIYIYISFCFCYNATAAHTAHTQYIVSLCGSK